MRIRFSVRLAALAVALLLATTIAIAKGPSMNKDGKKGQIKIAETVKVGDVTLQPGYYTIQHRVDGDQHLMHFIPKSDPHQDLTAPVECESGKKRWTSSSVWLTVKGNEKYIDKLMVKGEKIVYNFR